MTDSRRQALPLPAHVGVMLGLSTGAYALSIAGITALQAATEARDRVERAPTVAAIEALATGHDRVRARLDEARAAYEAAAGAYADAGLEVADLQARLAALAAAVEQVSGSAASLPGGVRLPTVSNRVVVVAPPTTQGSSGASGG